MSYLIRVCLSNHLLYLFVSEALAEMHHAVLELGLTDVAVAVSIEDPKL